MKIQNDSKEQNVSPISPIDSAKQQEQLLNSIYGTLKSLPSGLSKLHKEIQISESKIQSLSSQIEAIKQKLKPVSRIEKSRGRRKDATSGNKSFLRASLERLNKQMFVERDHWAAKMKEFREIVDQDVSKVRNEFTLVKARSLRYITRNKLLVERKFKKLLDETKSNPQMLSTLKDDLQSNDSKKIIASVKKFLEIIDSEGFLFAAYISQESLRDDFNTLLITLLNEWDATSENFEFGNVNAEFKITRTGAKR